MVAPLLHAIRQGRCVMGLSKTADVLDNAAERAAQSHTGAVAGRGAQTDNAENTANPQHSAFDVWKRTGEGIKDNDRKGDDQPLMGMASLMGLSTPFLGRAAGLMGRGAGGVAGYAAAAIEGAKSIQGIAKGVQAG